MIRKYQAKDLDSVLELWHEASLIAHPFLTAEFLQKERFKLRAVFLPQSETWVYVREGQVVGFLSLVENEVGGLFVRPSQQRRGVGKALMDKARSLHHSLELEVFEANKIGRAFYAKYGFVPIGKHWEEETGQMVIRLRYVF